MMIDLTKLIELPDGTVSVSGRELESVIEFGSFSSGNPFEDEEVRAIIEQTFLRLVDQPNVAEGLAYGNTAWRVSIAANVAKTSVVASVMIGLLHMTNATEYAALVLPAVLPLLIDIDSIQLTIKDDVILAELRRHDKLKYKNLDSQELYDLLGPTTQEQFGYPEFLDVLDALKLTGNLDQDEYTGLFKLTEKRNIRLIFK